MNNNNNINKKWKEIFESNAGIGGLCAPKKVPVEVFKKEYKTIKNSDLNDKTIENTNRNSYPCNCKVDSDIRYLLKSLGDLLGKNSQMEIIPSTVLAYVRAKFLEGCSIKKVGINKKIKKVKKVKKVKFHNIMYKIFEKKDNENIEIITHRLN